jgi:hypothetical protein
VAHNPKRTIYRIGGQDISLPFIPLLRDEHPAAEDDEPRLRGPQTHQGVNDEDALNEKQIRRALGRDPKRLAKAKLMRERSMRARFWNAGE